MKIFSIIALYLAMVSGLSTQGWHGHQGRGHNGHGARGGHWHPHGHSGHSHHWGWRYDGINPVIIEPEPFADPSIYTNV